MRSWHYGNEGTAALTALRTKRCALQPQGWRVLWEGGAAEKKADSRNNVESISLARRPKVTKEPRATETLLWTSGCDFGRGDCCHYVVELQMSFSASANAPSWRVHWEDSGKISKVHPQEQPNLPES